MRFNRLLVGLAMGAVLGSGAAAAGSAVGDNDSDREFVELSAAYADEAAQITTQNRYHGPRTKPRWLTTPCEYEDDYNCYWNARTMGNGEGHSFWAIRVGRGEVAIVYWNRRYNNRHGYITGR